VNRYALWSAILEVVDAASGGAAGDRQALAEPLRALQQKLLALLPQETVYQILFAVVVALDERLLARSDGAPLPRASLQEQFFQISDGGSRFYSRLEKLLSSRDTHAFTLEVYAFLLRDGFEGTYAASPERRAELLTQLDARITPQDRRAEAPATRRRTYAEEERSPRALYVAAMAVIVATWLLLWLYPDLQI